MPSLMTFELFLQQNIWVVIQTFQIRGHPYISWCTEGGLSQSVIMVSACFRPVIPLFRPTNCHFVIRWMIFTKNMLFIAKITLRITFYWKMSRNVIRFKKNWCEKHFSTLHLVTKGLVWLLAFTPVNVRTYTYLYL